MTVAEAATRCGRGAVPVTVLAILIATLVTATALADDPVTEWDREALARAKTPPLGLPPTPVPKDNPLTVEKIALGRKLFFDRRLSANGTMSCAMCHVPEQGFTQYELRTPVGVEGRSLKRNAPTILNVAHQESMFHDGRDTSLENQVFGPLLAANRVGGFLTVPASHTTGHTDHVPRRFPLRCNARCLSVRGVSPWAMNQSRFMASVAW